MGTDDGLIQGQQWKDVTLKMMPEWSLTSIIEPSRFDADASYVEATRYKLDDTIPSLWRTRDWEGARDHCRGYPEGCVHPGDA